MKRKQPKVGTSVWVVVWPSSGVPLKNGSQPAAFYTRSDARRYKRNSYYQTPLILRYDARAKKGTQ